MTNRYCGIYYTPSKASGMTVSVDILESSGIRLGRPGSNAIHRLDKYGEFVQSSRGDIESHFRTDGVVDFMLWADADSQVDVQFRQLTRDIHCQDYEFSALRGTPSWEPFWKAMSIILDQLLFSGDAICMIIDGHGHTEEFDWDGFITGANSLPLEMPDYLAMTHERARVLSLVFERFRQDCNGIWIYRRDDWVGPEMTLNKI